MTRLICLDTETDSTDVFNGHIVTAFLGGMNASGFFDQTRDWLIDFGGEIPAEAIAVHGITNERMRAEGRKDVARAIAEIADIIRQECVRGDIPLVAYNASFDCSLLQTELIRYGLPTLDFDAMTIVDPLIIDKAIDKYRRGSRRLVDTAAHYGIPVEANAHDASADSLMAGRVALRLLEHPTVRRTRDLQSAQRRWKAEQSRSLQAYFRSAKNKNGADPTAVVDPSWPIRLPQTQPEGATA